MACASIVFTLPSCILSCFGVAGAAIASAVFLNEPPPARPRAGVSREAWEVSLGMASVDLDIWTRTIFR